jgi:hypothetical protein
MRHSFGVGSRNLTARCESSIAGKGLKLLDEPYSWRNPAVGFGQSMFALHG